MAACAVFLAALAPASAQDARRLEAGAPEAAEQRYLIGRSLYLEGRFEAAAAEFETALDLFPSSAKLTYNLARTSERLGRIRDGSRLYERYLELSPDARDRSQVERVLRSLARRIEAESVELVLQSDPPGAIVYVDDGDEPLPRETPTRVRLAPGAHVVTFRLPGHAEASAAVEVQPGEARAISVRMLPLSSSASGASWRPVVGWSLLGVGLAAGAGLGAVFLGQASDARAEADALGVHPDEAGRYDDLEAEHGEARTLGRLHRRGRTDRHRRCGHPPLARSRVGFAGLGRRRLAGWLGGAVLSSADPTRRLGAPLCLTVLCVTQLFLGCEPFPGRPLCGAEVPCPGGYVCGPERECVASDDATVDADGSPGAGGSGQDGAVVSDGGTAADGGGSDTGRGDACVPAAEQCNGLDDDCDGRTDETIPQVGVQCQSERPGVCADGRFVCELGVLRCAPDREPTVERCDGTDEDCDGTVDEDAMGGCVPCDTGGVGACGLGSTVCVEGEFLCLRHRPTAAPACNLVDDDCDGEVDEPEETVGDDVRSDPLATTRCGERALGPLAPSPGEAVPGACIEPGRVGCGPVHACLDATCVTACDDVRAVAVDVCVSACAGDADCANGCAVEAAASWRACAGACPGTEAAATEYVCAEGPACTAVACEAGWRLRDGRCYPEEICNNGIDEDQDGLVDGSLEGPDPCAALRLATPEPVRVGACPRAISGTPEAADCPEDFTSREKDQCEIGACPKRVTTTYDYAIDREEVSMRAYLECVDSGCCPPPIGAVAAMARRVKDANLSPERPEAPERCMPVTRIDLDEVEPLALDLPATGLSWCAAREFCAWAGKRLVTETEFELAMVGDEPRRRFTWGETDLAECVEEQCCVEPGFQGPLPEPCDPQHVIECPAGAPAGGDGARGACLANYGRDDPDCIERHGSFGLQNIPSPTPVWASEDGATDDGILNLLGNVQEWTFDWATSNWGGQPDIDPVGPACSTVRAPSRRTVRGGTLFRSSDAIKPHLRESFTPGARLPTIGFRCARTVDRDPEGAQRVCNPGSLGSLVAPGDACRARHAGKPRCAAPDMESLHDIDACPGNVRVPSLNCTENVKQFCTGTPLQCGAMVLTRLVVDLDRVATIAAAISDESVAALADAIDRFNTDEANQSNATYFNNDLAPQGGTTLLALDLPCGFADAGTVPARFVNGTLDEATGRLHGLGARDGEVCADLPGAEFGFTVGPLDRVGGFCEFTEMNLEIRGSNATIPISAFVGYLGQIRRAPIRLEMGVIVALTERDAERSRVGDLRAGGVDALLGETTFEALDLCFFEAFARELRENADALAFLGGWECGAFETWPGCVQGVCEGVAQPDGSRDRSMCMGWALPLSMDALPASQARVGVAPCEGCEVPDE